MMVAGFFVSRALIRHILINAHKINLNVTEGDQQSLNLKVLASAIQTVVLIAFADVGRFEGEMRIDVKEILSRKTGMPTSARNNDGLGQKLFGPKDMVRVFDGTWLENTVRLVSNFCDGILAQAYSGANQRN
jgi:hypothetical protein